MGQWLRDGNQNRNRGWRRQFPGSFVPLNQFSNLNHIYSTCLGAGAKQFSSSHNILRSVGDRPLLSSDSKFPIQFFHLIEYLIQLQLEYTQLPPSLVSFRFEYLILPMMIGLGMVAAAVAATTVFNATGAAPPPVGVVVLLCAAFHAGMALIINGVRRGRWRRRRPSGCSSHHPSRRRSWLGLSGSGSLAPLHSRLESMGKFLFSEYSFGLSRWKQGKQASHLGRRCSSSVWNQTIKWSSFGSSV